MTRASRRLVALSTIALIACNDTNDTPPDAGLGEPAEVIVIADDSVTPGTLGDPVLVIGEGGGHEFVDIVGIVAVGDDIVVANGHSPPQIQVFGRDRALRLTVGGDGEGPGEFRGIRALWTEGDTIGALDMRLQRISRFDVNGNLLRTDAATWLLQPNYIPWARFDDGSWLLVQNIADSDEGMLKRRAARVRPGGTVIELGWFDDRPRQQVRGEYEAILFWPLTALYEAAGDEFYYAYPGAHELHVYDTAGTYVRRITRDVQPARVSNAILPALLERVYDDMRARGIVNIDEYIAGKPQPEVLPVLGGDMVADDEGVLWIADYPVPDAAFTRWSLYDRDGAHVGDVKLPTRFRPVDIDGDRLIGVWTDEMRVQSVRVYRADRQ